MDEERKRNMPGHLPIGLVAAAMLVFAGVVWRASDVGESSAPAADHSPAEAAVAVEPPVIDEAALAAGEAQIGCPAADEAHCTDSERPARSVVLPAFSIDRTEVTVAAYRACVAAGACSEASAEGTCNASLPDRDRHPINCVDWHQAVAYCAWRGARLPTEQEWERAARGTTGARFPWGDAAPDCTRAVIDEGSGNGCGAGDTTFEVGSRPAGASPEGVLDLIGNVWEWTATTPERSGARIVRGGGYYVEPGQIRASFGIPFDPRGRADYVGFRCAR